MAFALSVGVLAFFLLEPGRSSFVSPGQLTDAHAQVLKTQRAEACGSCHAAGARHANGWIRLALATGVGPVQNGKCLVCHRAKLGADAGLPHSLSARRLSIIAAATPATPPATARQILASFAPPPETSAHGEIACSACHQEHGGRRQNLKSLSDLSCQSCHKTQFQSFAHGHPEFKSVRHERDGIIFDHATHEPRMPGGKLDCAKCHLPDPVGKTMQFTTFAKACSGCHDQGKLDHHGDQIREGVQVVLQLPSMSLDKPAVWPGATLAPGTQLTPMLQFLIAGDKDPAALKALKSLMSDVVANGSTDDWDADSPTKAKLGLAIERVVKELSPDDAAGAQPSNRDLLRARIARAAGVSETAPAVTALLDGLTAPADTIKSWQGHTLPQLAQYLSRPTSPATAPATAPASPPAAASASVSPAAPASAAAPARALAPASAPVAAPRPAATLAIAPATAPAAAPAPAHAPAHAIVPATAPASNPAIAPAIGPATVPASSAPASPAIAPTTARASAPATAPTITPVATPATAPDTAPSTIAANNPAAAPATAPAGTPSAAVSTPATDANAAAPATAAPAEWKPPAIAPGWPGWFVDSSAVSINYRPIHGDPLYKAWIDLLASRAKPAKIVTTMSDEDFRAALRVQLLQKVGSSCIKCHEVQAENSAFVVNWQPAGHATRVPGYVKFDHKPHLTLFMGAENCSVCHKLQSAPSTPANPPATPANAAAIPVLFPTDKPNHNLAAHSKANCASCHMPTGSPDTCLTCHVYHMVR
jgi:hypothetical protein